MIDRGPGIAQGEVERIFEPFQQPHQLDLLRVFAVNQGTLMTHRMLLQKVWGPGDGSESNLQ